MRGGVRDAAPMSRHQTGTHERSEFCGDELHGSTKYLRELACVGRGPFWREGERSKKFDVDRVSANTTDIPHLLPPRPPHLFRTARSTTRRLCKTDPAPGLNPALRAFDGRPRGTRRTPRTAPLLRSSAPFRSPVAGKTGTAQTPHGSDHSWYASWAPAAHPRVVVVVLIEHGGFGVESAAPAAREIYSASST